LKFPHGARIARRQDNRMIDFLLRCMSPQLAHSRHFAATQYFGRFRGEADMNRIYEYAP
jgi:hypothetical protein